MGLKSILFTVFVLAFTATNASAKSAKISSTHDRMAVGAFENSGGSCSEASFNALKQCSDWVKDVTTQQGMGQSWCRKNSCICTTDGKTSQAACLGTFVYSQTISLNIDESGKKTGIVRGGTVNKYPTAIGEGSGITCMDAKFAAAAELYPQLEMLSNEFDATGLSTVVCNCKDLKGGDKLATCKGGVEALYRAPVALK